MHSFSRLPSHIKTPTNSLTTYNFPHPIISTFSLYICLHYNRPLNSGGNDMDALIEEKHRKKHKKKHKKHKKHRHGDEVTEGIYLFLFALTEGVLCITELRGVFCCFEKNKSKPSVNDIAILGIYTRGVQFNFGHFYFCNKMKTMQLSSLKF